VLYHRQAPVAGVNLFLSAIVIIEKLNHYLHGKGMSRNGGDNKKFYASS